MSTKLTPKHRRALEILLELGIKELLQERSRRAFNRTLLKKTLQTYIYRTSLEFPDNKNDVSSIKKGSAGTDRYNYDNERGKNDGSVSKLHSSKDPRTEELCSSFAFTRNTTIRITSKTVNIVLNFLNKYIGEMVEVKIRNYEEGQERLNPSARYDIMNAWHCCEILFSRPLSTNIRFPLQLLTHSHMDYIPQNFFKIELNLKHNSGVRLTQFKKMYTLLIALRHACDKNQ
ncbi:15917_t:CDS:2, partial [Funneliformis geosporum]